MSFTDFILYFGGALGVGITLGGLVLAIRTGYSKAASDIQERVISALREERDTLNDRIASLEKDRDRQNSIISTIRYALKQYSLKIVIEGDFVTLSEPDGKSRKIVRIQDRTAMLDEDEAK